MNIRPVRQSGTLTAVAAMLAAAMAAATTMATPALAQEVKGYELALVDMRGGKDVLGTLPPSIFAPRVSPDGTQVVFELADAPAADGAPAPTRLWVAPLDDISKRRQVPPVGTGRNLAGVWTPDGKRVVFLVSDMVAADGKPLPDALYIRNADGSGEAEKLVDGRAPEGLYADGGRLNYIVLTGESDYGIWSLDMATRQGTKLVDGSGSEQHSSRVSPDGKWIAYTSNDTGQHEIWIEPLPQTGKRFKVSSSGGAHPVWSDDGLKVYYDHGGSMYRVEMFLDEKTPQTSEPEVMPVKGFQQGERRRQFDLVPGAPQFLMLFPVR
jgi:Tol biopolymer transport system component